MRDAERDGLDGPDQFLEPSGSVLRHEVEWAEASFLELVNMVAMQAIVSIGGYQLPTGEHVPADLAMAKHQIDMLEMLEKKTSGNLIEEEKKALAGVLYELRMQYVQSARVPKV